MFRRGQKCIAVIERKVLIVLLFANTSDYLNKTCMYMYRYNYVLVSYKYASLVGVVTCICEEQYN